MTRIIITHLEVRRIRDRVTAPVKIPPRLPFQIRKLERKRLLVLMHHPPRSVKIAVERHDDDWFALPAAIHGCQPSRLPEDLADDADDEDAVPCVVDPLAARVVLREIRIERTLFFHEGFELPKVDGIAVPEQKWSGFLRLGRRVMGVRAMHLVHVLMRIAPCEDQYTQANMRSTYHAPCDDSRCGLERDD